MFNYIIKTIEQIVENADYKKAIKILHDLINHEPDNYMAFHDLGIIMWQNGEIDSAVECLKRSYDINKSNITLITNFCEVLNRLNKHELAKNIIKKYKSDYGENLSLSDFIILGAQKSCTTYIQFCLKEHPEIFMPEDEISFFEYPDYNNSSLYEFSELIPKDNQIKKIGIKRPSYLGKQESAELISRHIPNVKLIIILRDPIERAISAYFHNMNTGFLPILDVNEGLINIINGKYIKEFPRSSEVLEFGFYYKHIMNYLKFFKKEQFLILLDEDIKTNPINCLKKIFSFIDVNNTFIPEFINKRISVGVYSLERIRLNSLIIPITSYFSQDKMRLHKKEKIKPNDIKFIKTIKYIDENIMIPIFGNKKQTCNLEVKKALSSIYKDDTVKLEKLLQRELRHWKVF